MKIAGLVKQSLVDYPGEVAAVLFSQGCNLSCPFCHNGHLISINPKRNYYIEQEQVEQFFLERQGFLDGVVFSGGEPTLQPELSQMAERLKKQGYLLKLDTNGTNSKVLEDLLEKQLLDYIAMDIKAPLEFKKYKHACGGRLTPLNFMNIRNSIQLLLKQQDLTVEFRTTVVPALHKTNDIVDISKAIKGAAGYTLQQFNPEKPWSIHLRAADTYTRKEMEEIASGCREFVQNVRVLTM